MKSKKVVETNTPEEVKLFKEVFDGDWKIINEEDFHKLPHKKQIEGLLFTLTGMLLGIREDLQDIWERLDKIERK